jgi:cytochrome c
MKRFPGVLVALLLLVVSFMVSAQEIPLGIGRVVPFEELRSWTYSVGPQGKELLPGRGTAKEGEAIYTKSCVFCHGPGGENGPYNNLKGSPMFNYATSLWDYIHRAMPRQLANAGAQERQLSPNEVYALTAYLLYINGLFGQNAVLDQKTILQVRMIGKE